MHLYTDISSSVPVVRMLDFFQFGNHFCIVFPLLGESLLERFALHRSIPTNHISHSPISTLELQKIALQIITGLTFLKQHDLIHADLKPENILLNHSYKSKTSASVSLCIIDLGNAFFPHDSYLYADDFEVQSLFYRAPEVLIGLNFDFAIDMWSLGIILLELVIGKPIFQSTSPSHLLRCICSTFGHLPSHIFAQGKMFPYYFAQQPSTFAEESTKLPPSLSGHFVNTLSRVTEMVGKQDPHLAHFIASCLNYDPKMRMTPSQALFHPFLSRLFPFSTIFTPENSLPICTDQSTFSSQTQHVQQNDIKREKNAHETNTDISRNIADSIALSSAKCSNGSILLQEKFCIPNEKIQRNKINSAVRLPQQSTPKNYVKLTQDKVECMHPKQEIVSTVSSTNFGLQENDLHQLNGKTDHKQSSFQQSKSIHLPKDVFTNVHKKLEISASVKPTVYSIVETRTRNKLKRKVKDNIESVKSAPCNVNGFRSTHVPISKREKHPTPLTGEIESPFLEKSQHNMSVEPISKEQPTSLHKRRKKSKKITPANYVVIHDDEVYQTNTNSLTSLSTPTKSLIAINDCDPVEKPNLSKFKHALCSENSSPKQKEPAIQDWERKNNTKKQTSTLVKGNLFYPAGLADLSRYVSNRGSSCEPLQIVTSPEVI